MGLGLLGSLLCLFLKCKEHVLLVIFFFFFFEGFMIYLGMEVIISSSELGEKFFIVTLYPLFYFMRCIFKQGVRRTR